MPEPSLFRHYQIVQDADGNNVEVVRDAEQIAVLAFDTRRQEFVQCHVLLTPLSDRAAFDQACRKWQQVTPHPLLARLLDAGEDEGSLFYITAPVEGESLRAYLQRQPHLPGAWAGSVMRDVVDIMTALAERGGLGVSAGALRVVQAGERRLQAYLADVRVIPRVAVAGGPTLSATARVLLSLADHAAQAGAALDGEEVWEALDACWQSVGFSDIAALRSLRTALFQRFDPSTPLPEWIPGWTPRPLLASYLAPDEELQRALSAQVEALQPDPEQPYSWRGLAKETGGAVRVEELPSAHLVGNGVRTWVEQILKVGQKDVIACLLPVALLDADQGPTCLIEEWPEGFHLGELLNVRGALDARETHRVLTALDQALTQLERAGGFARLRLEDIYLRAGDASQAQVSLLQWPVLVVTLRAHPTLASLGGRGLDPALWLPENVGVFTSWSSAWLASVGRLLLGLAPRPGFPARKGTDAIGALLEEEIRSAPANAGASRADLLKRYAALLPRPEPARSVLVTIAAGATSEPLAPPLTTGQSASEEKPSIGFAELLFRDVTAAPEEAGPSWTKSAADAPPSIHPDETLLPPHNYVPLWLRATVFIGGSLLLGALLAFFFGDSRKPSPSTAKPSAAPIKVEVRQAPVKAAPVQQEPIPPLEPPPVLDGGLRLPPPSSSLKGILTEDAPPTR